MSLFDDAVFNVPDVNETPAPTSSAITSTPTLLPTRNLRAPTLAPTAEATDAIENDENISEQTLSPQIPDGGDDKGLLSSLLYYQNVRSSATDVSRRDDNNLDILTDPNTNERIAICHMSTILSFTRGNFVPSRNEAEDAFAIALALQHLNTGDGSIVREVGGLNQRCNIRFTLELADDQFEGGVALEHVVVQTSRSLPNQKPCAFIGARRSAVSIPMSIVTGLFDYPQVSGASTSIELDDKSQYPLFGRTVPSDAGNAIPIILYMHQVLKLKHLAVINVNDAFGNALVDGLRAAAAEYSPEMIIHQIPLDEGQGSIEAAIQNLKSTQFRFVFCVVFTPELNDAILEEAYKQDVAGNGKHNWLFGDAFQGTLDERRFQKDSPLSMVYRGIGLLQASGGVEGVPGFDNFADQMRSLKTPTNTMYVGNLFPQHDHPSYPATVAEHPFLFAPDFMNPLVDGYAPFYYEAAIALGLAACNATDSFSLNGQQHHETFRNTTFSGVAGTVAFDSITGTRLPTHTLYKVANWIPQTNAEDGSVTFQPIVSDLFLEGVWQRQVPYIFNDGTTRLPVDIAPPEPQDTTNMVLVVALPVIVALLSGVAIFLFYENKRKQNDSVWKIDRSELQFADPPQVIGQGTFGKVLLAEYRGTSVAVKHILPPVLTSVRKPDKSTSTDRSRSTDNDYSESYNDIEESTERKSRGMSSWGGASLNNASGSHSSLQGSALSSFTSRRRESELSKRRRIKFEFLDEMRQLSKLRHPCVTTIMGAVVDKGEPMMVMEYMDHGSLYNLLHNETVVLENEMLLNFLRDVSQGIRFLHSAIPQVIHGDLKAANILVDRRFRAKVADFGLAQNRKLGGTGTPFWMAPELLRRESTNTAKTDVYSFGIILYEVYSRRDPYEGEDPRLVLKGVKDQAVKKRPPFPKHMGEALKFLMSECVEDDPSRRPSFDEIDGRLQRLDDDCEATDTKPKSSVSLFDIFPKHVAEALRDGRAVEPEHRDVVTIFFSDIVGFTDISASMEPRKVATMLDRLYTKFDALSHVHEIFKLETIGDAYVGKFFVERMPHDICFSVFLLSHDSRLAVTNLVKDQPSDHAKRIAEFAIDAIVAANETPIDPDDPSAGTVKIRVGFHSGPVVADVVGTRNPRYCLFGDSVNTASRMESNSKVNRIHCSDAAAQILREQSPGIPLKCRGTIKVKGKGEMRTWWVNEGAGHQFRSQYSRKTLLAISEAKKGSKLGAFLEDFSTDLTAERLSADCSVSSASDKDFSDDGSTNERDVNGKMEMILQETAPAPREAVEMAPILEKVPSAGKTVTVDIKAPPGRLGIVIERILGQPVVHQVAETSPIKDYIAVGDILCELDGVDIRSMSHAAIAALMSTNAHRERRFRIERKQ